MGGFNSRARKGRDVRYLEALIAYKSFNSRARKGRDIEESARFPRYGKFQFTRPQGARPAPIVNGEPNGGVSIHAPARGATETTNKSLESITVSIHAPARGATQTPVTMSFPACFNSRARKGRD